VSSTIDERLAGIADLSAKELDALEKELDAVYDEADSADDFDAMQAAIDGLEKVVTAREELSSKKDSDEKPAEEPEQPKADEKSEPEETSEKPEPAKAEESEEEKPEAEAETEKTEVKAEDEAPVAEVKEIAPATDDKPTEATDTEESNAMAASADFTPPEDRQPVVASAPTRVYAGADIPGVTAGAEFNNATEVSEALLKRLETIRRAYGGDGEQHLVASVRADIPEERMLHSGDLDGNARKIEAVTGEEAIVAAGGYCAPLQVRYDIFGLGDTTRPVKASLPAFGTARGGIRYVTPPVLADYGAAVGVWTAAGDAAASAVQVVSNKALTSNVATLTTASAHGYSVGQTVTININDAAFDGTYTIASVPTSTTFTYAKTHANVTSAAADGSSQLTKPMLVADCADELTATADAITLQLKFGNLMARAFPELVTRHNQLALIMHARISEQQLLAKIGAASLAVTASLPALGTARDFFHQISRAASAYRNRHRMARTTPMRVIAPEWVLDAAREDLAMQIPGDDKLAVADATITSYLNARNVNVTWHMDDAMAAQSAGAMNQFPATFKWYLFAEGTFLFLDGGTLDLGIVRDSGLVGTNDYITFTETFEGLAKVGVESLQVTTTTQTQGATSATKDVADTLAAG